jgi:hypothetical protein
MNAQLAFQGQQQALDYIANLTNASTAANNAEISSRINSSRDWWEVAGVGASIFTGQQGETGTNTSGTSSGGTGAANN